MWILPSGKALDKFKVRFWSKVLVIDDEDSCWFWQASLTHIGDYGHFGVATNRTEKAHRVAYCLEVRMLVDGENVLHKCNNPACVRPSHLYVGTKLDNALDRRDAGVGPEKLNWEKVREIRQLYGLGVGLVTLADAYGVTPSAIHHIVKGRSWKERNSRSQLTEGVVQ